MPVDRLEARQKRHRRVRKKVFGTPERPRLAVYRSNRQIYAQLIDDYAGKTLLAASSLGAGNGKGKSGDPKERAKAVGKNIAEKAKKAGITAATFDRGGFKYHGRVAAVAEGARDAGLEL